MAVLLPHPPRVIIHFFQLSRRDRGRHVVAYDAAITLIKHIILADSKHFMIDFYAADLRHFAYAHTYARQVPFTSFDIIIDFHRIASFYFSHDIFAHGGYRL